MTTSSVCDGAHAPCGYTDDQPAEAEDAINMSVPGAIKGTRKVMATAALGEYADIYAAAAGQVQGEPAVVGTYYKVGSTVRASQVDEYGNYITEAVLARPAKLIVLAHTAQFADLATALTGSPGALIKFLAS